MRVILQLEHTADLEILLPLLERLGVKVVTEESPMSDLGQLEKPPLAKHIGSLPTIDVAAFEKYLRETRN